MVYDNGSALAQFRRYDGPGDPNLAANWTAAVDIGYADSPSLASGPLGLFMLSGTQTNAMTVRRFDGATFAAPVQVLPSGEDVHELAHPGPRGPAARGDPAGGGGRDPPRPRDVRRRRRLALGNGARADRRRHLRRPLRGGRRPRRRGGVVDRHVRRQGHPGGGDRARRARRSAAGASTAGRHRAPPPAPPAGRAAQASKPPATAVRLANGSVRVVVKGVLRRPAGVSRSRGCRGTVRVRFKRGKRAIGAKTVKVAKTCAFRRKLLLAASKVRAARKLAMTVRFNGNAAMAPAARTYALPIKRRR